MGLRHKSIRIRVILLVLIPLVSLIGVYSYATSTTVRTAVDLVRAGTVSEVTVKPTANLVKQIDAERSLAVTYLIDPTNTGLAKFNKQEALTDAALKTFEGVSHSGPIAANASPLEKAMAATLINATKGVPGLPGLRASVVANGITRQEAIAQYSALASDGYRVIYQAIQKTNISQSIVTTALQQTNMYEAEQLLLQESDLYVGDAATGSFPPGDRTEFAQLVALRRDLISEALPQLDATSRSLYARHVPASSAAAVTALENKIIHSTARRDAAPVPLATWAPAVTAYATGMGTFLTDGTTAIVAQVKSSARTTLIGLSVAGGLGLLAIIASVLFSFLIGRGLLRQLRELRQSALELANDRLPDVMQRLREGKQVDVAIEAPPVEASSDEIDQVRQAFNIVQRTAIEAAVDEANLRQGVSEVFRNLARRSQVLLHRQLRLLDGMERRANEPEELEDLFRIDHLTTRMRRHAEGLIILSGESPGRSWRHPVPLMDVLRAAVAEVEDYTRIRVDTRSRAALAGSAVADVIHLIAELAENATVFSPPNTAVRIHGDIVGRGFAVEVEDRGLGITEERLAEINKNLESPPAFDLSGSDRLGLFIAGQLARRHNIKITLRPSPYGGTTAIVIIPLDLVVDEGTYDNVPSIGADGRGQLTGRHAALADGRANGGRANGGRVNGGRISGREEPDSAASWPAGARPTVTALPTTSVPTTSVPATGLPSRPGPAVAPAPPARPAETPELPVRRGPADPLPIPAGAAGDEPVWPEVPWPDLVLPRSVPAAASGNRDSRVSADLRDLSDTSDFGNFGLPRRVRQASLAPQLRDAPADDRPLPSEPRQATPEAARNTMAALQRGWERGRSGPAHPSPGGDGAHDGSGQ
jgi:signal transduction histidine kinase